MVKAAPVALPASTSHPLPPSTGLEVMEAGQSCRAITKERKQGHRDGDCTSSSQISMMMRNKSQISWGDQRSIGRYFGLGSRDSQGGLSIFYT